MAESKDNNQNKRVHSSNSNFSIFLPNHVLNEIEAYKNKNLKYSISTKNIQKINIQKKNEKKIEENSETINEQNIEKKEETYINDPRNLILKKSLSNNFFTGMTNYKTSLPSERRLVLSSPKSNYNNED